MVEFKSMEEFGIIESVNGKRATVKIPMKTILFIKIWNISSGKKQHNKSVIEKVLNEKDWV